MSLWWDQTDVFKGDRILTNIKFPYQEKNSDLDPFPRRLYHQNCVTLWIPRVKLVRYQNRYYLPFVNICQWCTVRPDVCLICRVFISRIRVSDFTDVSVTNVLTGNRVLTKKYTLCILSLYSIRHVRQTKVVNDRPKSFLFGKSWSQRSRTLLSYIRMRGRVLIPGSFQTYPTGLVTTISTSSPEVVSETVSHSRKSTGHVSLLTFSRRDSFYQWFHSICRLLWGPE